MKKSTFACSVKYAGMSMFLAEVENKSIKQEAQAENVKKNI